MTQTTPQAHPAGDTAERIELAGGWSFQFDTLNKTGWYITAPPDLQGYRVPHPWGEVFARQFAAALAPAHKPGDERVAELLDWLQCASMAATDGHDTGQEADQARTALLRHIAALEAEKAALVEVLKRLLICSDPATNQTGLKRAYEEARAALDAVTTSQERDDG